MNLSLVTLNFNGAHDTIRLLASLEAQSDSRYTIVAVDNDSSPEDRELLGTFAASATLALDIVHATSNGGFSAGNNLGIRKALSHGADWVILINNDTVVGPEFISTLRASLPDEPAVIGLPLDEGDRIAYAGATSWLTPTLAHRHTPSTSTTDYAIGACVAIHRDVFKRIGMLDERYFLYFEDAEFSARARHAGIPVSFITTPTVRHWVSSSTRALGSPTLLRYHFRNMIRFHRQHAPLWARVALPLVLTWHVVKQTLKVLVGISHAQSTAILLGIRDGILDRDGAIHRRPVIAVECESLEDTSWGVARQVRGFLEAFVELPEVRRTYDVVAYFKSHIPDEPWLRHPHVRAVLVRPIPLLPASFSLYFYVFFPIRVWWDRPAVTFISNYMLPLIFHGKSVVMLTEDVWHEMHGHALPFKYRLAYRIFASWAARRATRIMAISHASAQRVAELFGIQQSRIVVNELAVPAPMRVVPREGRYFLYVAQGLPRRHLRETILAFARIAVSHPELTLLAIGPDKYIPHIISKLVDTTNMQLGREAVTWIERVTEDELASAYAGAQAIVYVSDMEAFGLPPVEALSYGVPAILMDAPVHRELFGEHAFYVPDGSVERIATALEEALTNQTKRESIRQAAQSIVARYTWDAHARRMLNIIKHML